TATSSVSSTASPSSSRKPCRSKTSSPWAPAPCRTGLPACPVFLSPSGRCYSRKTMDAFPPTGRTTVRRLPQRGVYDKAAVYSILDEGFICHVGFAVDGQPYVIPTGYARSGAQIFFHGSAASR